MSKTRFKHAVTVVSSVAVLFSYTGSAFADQYDSQISSLKAQAAAQAAQAAAAQANVSTYQQQVAEYQAQANAIQAQINLNNAKAAQLQAAVTDAETKLANQKVVLAANLKQMYLDSGVTPLEMLASSQTIGDYMDKQQYQDKVKQKIQDSMASVVTLEAQLKSQQQEVATVLATEQNQKQQVQALTDQANALLATAANDEAAANAQVKASNAQISQLKTAQAAMYAAIQNSTGGGSSGTVGSFKFKNWTGNMGACRVNLIDCNLAQDSVVDPWGLYNRECVSYTAWAMVQRGANMPYVGGSGMAYQWPSTLAARGYTVNSDPNGVAVVAIAPRNMIASGDVGHAMVVESVLGNGWIHVSQYNWGENGQYSEMDVATAGLLFIHFR